MYVLGVVLFFHTKASPSFDMKKLILFIDCISSSLRYRLPLGVVTLFSLCWVFKLTFSALNFPHGHVSTNMLPSGQGAL